MKLPAAIFEYVKVEINHYPREKHPECYELISYPRLYQEGYYNYQNGRFDRALGHFEKALQLQPQDEAALLGNAWTLLKLRSEKDLTVQSMFLRIPDSVQLASQAYPKEWIQDTHCQRFKALKNLYNHGQSLYGKNAFEEVLELLDCHSAFIGEKVLLVELKFKCLWELNKPSRMLWECGELLKAKAHATDSDIAEKNLSEDEKLMVQDTVSRYLSLNHSLSHPINFQ
jgi:tetratricopeptide (TPR) repeat protein